ncbi:hypothetical protein SISNIDRAFT_543553 [Sistotremastrum niveocremeum HHB9708]|uniref:F-box domain-containing protein n=1 Tax=Sistotremastrum niveocremeum HHB9708 TaxID=1314777 RepID=A0A164WPX4_9AGAM|nr:hypothetical protein SISNIDRAFT_543553 [Sistotremastrum niveocremeum HHB9708]
MDVGSNDPSWDALLGPFEKSLTDELEQRMKKFTHSSAKMSALEGAEHKYRLRVSPAFSVCATWRQIAINTPTLWSRISLPTSGKLFKLFRDRSRSVPLDVITTCYADDDGEVMGHGDALRQIIPRISRLELADPGLSAADFFKENVCQREFSSLLILEISILDWDEQGLYTLNAPVIHTLIYHGPPSLRPLVHPHRLVNLSYSPSQATSSQLLGILSEMPNLEQCSIRNEDDSENLGLPSSNVARAKVPLPRLKRLHISNLSSHKLIHLLEHLVLPPCASVELRVFETGPTTSGDFFRFAGSYMASCDSLEITKSEAISPENFEYDSRLANDYPLGEGPGICLKLRSETRGPVKLHWIFDEDDDDDSMFPRIEYQSLETLASYPNDLIFVALKFNLPTTRELIEALSSWSCLSHICVQVSEDDFERFLTALEDTPDIICPALTILDCCGIRFSSVRMASFLEFRKDRGVPIHEIIMTRGFAEGGVDEFIHLVPTVSFIEPEVESEAKEVDTASGSEGEGEGDTDEDEDD